MACLVFHVFFELHEPAYEVVQEVLVAFALWVEFGEELISEVPQTFKLTVLAGWQSILPLEVKVCMFLLLDFS